MSTDILLCAVCGDKRDVRNHYGIVSCKGSFNYSGPGCKAFFRRAIADAKNYECSKNGNCTIDMATRNHCKACRLEKCKKVGMKETVSPVLDQHYGRNVSLEDGIRRPELVAPRVKNRFTCERILRGEDMNFYWYRGFVTLADYANSIPQFRQMSIEDRCQLFRHNFGCVAWMVYSHLFNHVDLSFGFPVGTGAYLPADGIPDYGPKRPEVPNAQDILSRFNSLMREPFQEERCDLHEKCFIKTMLLFSFEENLSIEGREICVSFQNRLIDALHDYQIFKYPDWTEAQRSRRMSRILLLIPRIYLVMHLEHDIQLVLSVFNTINIDGIPRELLFYTSK